MPPEVLSSSLVISSRLLRSLASSVAATWHLGNGTSGTLLFAQRTSFVRLGGQLLSGHFCHVLHKGNIRDVGFYISQIVRRRYVVPFRVRLVTLRSFFSSVRFTAAEVMAGTRTLLRDERLNRHWRVDLAELEHRVHFSASPLPAESAPGAEAQNVIALYDVPCARSTPDRDAVIAARRDHDPCARSSSTDYVVAGASVDVDIMARVGYGNRAGVISPNEIAFGDVVVRTAGGDVDSARAVARNHIAIVETFEASRVQAGSKSDSLTSLVANSSISNAKEA